MLQFIFHKEQITLHKQSKPQLTESDLGNTHTLARMQARPLARIPSYLRPHVTANGGRGSVDHEQKTGRTEAGGQEEKQERQQRDKNIKSERTSQYLIESKGQRTKEEEKRRKRIRRSKKQQQQKTKK